MKKILYTFLVLILCLGTSSCSDFLDVNRDPNNPDENSASLDIRLPWIQNYYMYAWASASMRSSTLAGMFTQTSTVSANGAMASWNPYQSICTTAYQHWFLGGWVNLKPLMKNAEEQEAWHYLGAAYIIRAMGTAVMMDLHGEIPWTEANADGIFAPKYDDGETLYKAVMADIDKAIEYFGMSQNTGAPAFSAGDKWNAGDVNKWLKLCYGMKARYLLQVSKKGIYDNDAVLAAVNSALQSNADNTIEKNYNDFGDGQFTFDKYNECHIWNSLAWGSTQRATRWYKNLMTNTYTGGSGVVDPRITKLLPSIMTNIVADASGNVVSYDWAIDAGVDVMNSSTRIDGGPMAPSYAAKEAKIKYVIEDSGERNKFVASFPEGRAKVEGNSVEITYPIGSFYINSTNYKRAGDTIYVNMRAYGMTSGGLSPEDTYFYANKTAKAVAATGTFFARPDSDAEIMTYAEMCFIKAEALLRKGDKGGALNAYKAGVEAAFDRMQTRLAEWGNVNPSNPFIQPMDAAEVADYLASDAVVQSAGDLTIADIIKQKIIAMGPNLQIWNDMRRLDYSAGDKQLGVAYFDYKRPYDFTATQKITGGSPSEVNYWFRRFSHSTHESNYNNTNLMASHPRAMQDDIWCQPVWWDIAE